MEPPWERVWTVSDWYDGPRAGVADVGGVPHAYRAEQDHGLDDHYRIIPVSAGDLALALEDWAIWERFDEAHRAGRADAADHPALPADRAHHQEIERLLGDRLVVPRDGGRRMRATFEPAAAHGLDGWMCARWFPVP